MQNLHRRVLLFPPHPPQSPLGRKLEYSTRGGGGVQLHALPLLLQLCDLGLLLVDAPVPVVTQLLALGQPLRDLPLHVAQSPLSLFQVNNNTQK